MKVLSRPGHACVRALLCAALFLVLLPRVPARAQTVDDVRRAYDSEPPERVEALLQSALRSSPSDPAILLLAGEMRSDRGQLAEADSFLRRVLASGATPALRQRAHLELGRLLYERDDTAGARVQLDAALAPREELAQAARWYLHLFGLDRTYVGWRSLESEHLRLHVQPGTPVDADWFLASRDSGLAEIQGFFGARLPKKVDIFLWRSSEDAERTGLPALGFARPIMSLIHARPGQSRGHELAHVVEYWTDLAWRPTRLIREGTAACFDLNAMDRLDFARTVLRRAGVTSVSIEQLWGDRGEAPETLIYPVGALLVRRLIDRGGRERFLAFLPDQSLENARRIYGDSLAQIIADTEHDLAAD